MKVTELKQKEQADLERLNTKNLLAYYKAERKRFYSFVSAHTCDCCGEPSWRLEPKRYVKEEQQYHDWEKYFKTIKEILSTREHVIRKNK